METPPSQAHPRDAATAMQIAGLVTTAVVITNVAFYFLSDLYFEDRAALYGAVTSAQINGVRVAFGIFTGTIGIASVVAALAPRYVGHAIAGLFGLASFVSGILAIGNSTPVLPASLIVTGLAMPVLVWKSYERHRGAWATLIGMTSVLAAVLLFGSTKVRGALDIGLWHALILPGLLTVATIALAMVREDYAES